MRNPLQTILFAACAGLALALASCHLPENQQPGFAVPAKPGATVSGYEKINPKPLWLRNDWRIAQNEVSAARKALDKAIKKQKPGEMNFHTKFEFGSDEGWVVEQVARNLKRIETAMDTDWGYAMVSHPNEMPIHIEENRPPSDVPWMGAYSFPRHPVVYVHPDVSTMKPEMRRRMIVHQMAHIAIGAQDLGYASEMRQREWYHTGHNYNRPADPRNTTRLTTNERLNNADSYARLVFR